MSMELDEVNEKKAKETVEREDPFRMAGNMVRPLFGFRGAWMGDFAMYGLRKHRLVNIQQRYDFGDGQVSYMISVVQDDKQHSLKKRWKEWLVVD